MPQSHTFKPTNQQGEVPAILREQLSAHRNERESPLGGDLSNVNTMLRGKNVPNVIGGPAVIP